MSIPVFNPSKPRMRRKRQTSGTPIPPPAGPPVLVAASVGADYASLTLVFDRAIEISAFDGSTAYVNIPAANSMYQPDTEIVQVDAYSLRASLDYFDQSTSAQTTLTVGEPTGIVAVDSGIAWGGCDGVELPLG